jgi:hypothetical protein
MDANPLDTKPARRDCPFKVWQHQYAELVGSANPLDVLIPAWSKPWLREDARQV